MRFKTLGEWLAWQTSLHSCAIDLGLDRVGEVARRLDLLKPPHPVVTVAGTNGKGSCVAMLEAILSEAGHKVGSYTSPHLLRYNERVRVSRRNVTDEQLCEAFALIDEARAEISLSYFEFATLAAMLIFNREAVDVAVLEVGLGGRLDAVNLQSADVAVISSIGLDHTEWLGNDRESIGHEKAGILRPNQPAVCGDLDPPESIGLRSRELNASLHYLGKDFSFTRTGKGWMFKSAATRWADLPEPALFGSNQFRNAATVLMALQLMPEGFLAPRAAVEAGLRSVALAGRFQRMGTSPEIVLDVAHNPHGVETLAENLSQLPKKSTRAVFAVLDDKDAVGMAALLGPAIDFWHLCEAKAARALPVQTLFQRIRGELHEDTISCHATVKDAFDAARAASKPDERIVVLGSFYTVAEALVLARPIDPD